MADFVAATQVTLTCPSGNGALYRATNRILAVLLRQREVQAWGGLTYSSPRPPVFHGHFWNEGTWEHDRNVLIFFDILNQGPADILPYFVEIQALVDEIYQEEGQRQKALWITAQPLFILGG